MAKSKRMSKDELASAVDRQISDAKQYDGQGRTGDREWAIRFFEGEVDFPASGEHRSTVVSRDVADTHGLIMPGLMRAFFASDRIAIYEPTRAHVEKVPEEDENGQPVIDPMTSMPRMVEKDLSEERADQATDLVNYVVMKECDGYRQFRSAFSDGLLHGNGPVKHWWDDTPQYETESYSSLSEAQYRLLLKEMGEDDEELDHEEVPDPDYKAPELPPIAPPMAEGVLGDPMAVANPLAMLAALLPPPVPMLHNTTIKRMRSKGRLRFMAMPNEELLIDKSAIVIDEDIRFIAHRRRRVTRSDLIKEGYPRAKVDAIPSFSEGEASAEEAARHGERLYGENSPDKSTEYVEVFECYPLIDYDGDGIAERRRVVMAGTGGKRNMLADEEWGDDLPFSDIVPDPRPHTWKGRSLYDLVGDIQRVKTVAQRGILDNTYQQLTPQWDVEVGAYENMDEIIRPTFGGLRLRKTGKNPAVPVQIPFIGDKIFGVLGYMDNETEKRTGISQRSQALDMDALQNQSATAVNAAQSAAYSKIEEYARNIAECGGMKRIFQCIYRLIVKHQDRAKTIRLRGKWVDIDPTGWAADMDVRVNTGLGTGSRDRDLAMLQGIAAKQEQAISVGGPLNENLNVGHLFDTYRKMAEAAGVNNPEAFFPDISQDDVKRMREAQEKAGEGKPDPAMMAQQAKLQFDQLKAQADIELKRQQAMADLQLAQGKAAAELQAQRERDAMRFQADRERFALELQLLREKAQAEILVEREKASAAIQMRREEMAVEAELTAQANAMKMQTSVPVADTNINRQEF